MSDLTLAWHFVNGKLRDGSDIPSDGEWLHHNGKCVMCEKGLHASERLLDALQYAPGSTICRVVCANIVKKQSDKLVCRSRFIMWRLEEQDELLRAFAREAALSVIHLWNAPDIVRRYLEMGEERLRAAAWAAASAAARAAASAAASAAARDAASAAARDAASAAASAVAWAAASAVAWAAARAAAWAAARDAASAAARDAARAAPSAAARAAARDAARAAASDAARAAALDKLNIKFENAVLSARGNPNDVQLLAQVPTPSALASSEGK